ncbi:MAG: phosphotransacetylase family protein [Cyanobacteria bacterium]|nr:phosphotransacetylase family protein [Cyanobacteriota bacterium]MDA0865529.1 phosphotransacetylase family protein [Cyanobacteriota bacterium]
MPKSAKYVLIGSTEAHSGKSAITLAIAFQLMAQGIKVAYGKPLATVEIPDHQGASVCADTDLNFIPEVLSLPATACLPTLLCLDEDVVTAQMHQNGAADFTEALHQYSAQAGENVVLVEGPATLEQGALVKLALPDMAKALDASVLLVMRFNPRQMVDEILSAQQRLGSRLLGVVINGIPEADQVFVTEKVLPYLEGQGIAVLATLPQMPYLQGVRVSELVRRLDAEVLCCDNHLDLVVESLKIGAMNVNSALRFFRQGIHQAVVTGGDRRDLQIAALETSTHCLILTGQISPTEDVITFATDKEIPVLSVVTDTLTTVERIDTLFGQVPLNNPDQVPLVQEVLAKHLDISRLMALLAIDPPTMAETTAS